MSLVGGPDDLTLRGLRSAVEIDVIDDPDAVQIDLAGESTQDIQITLPGVGLVGPTGPPGPAGESGSSGRFFDYVYVPTEGARPFGVGELMADGTLQFDTIDEASASVVYVSSLTASGVDVSARIVALPIGAPLWVQDRDDSNMHATFLLTGVATYDDVLGAWALPVAYDAGNSAGALVAGQAVLAGALETGTGIPGPQGPTGPTGPAGSTTDALAYVHTQSSAATVWTINHPMTFQPNITVVDSLKQEIWPGNVEYLTGSTIRLTFSAAVGGEAYLS